MEPQIIPYTPDCCSGVFELHLLQYQENRRDVKFQFTDSDKCGVLLRLTNGIDYQYRTRYLGATVYHERIWDGNDCGCANDDVLANLSTWMNPFYRVLMRDSNVIQLQEDHAKADGGIWHPWTRDEVVGQRAYYRLKRVGTAAACGDSKCAATHDMLGVKYTDDDPTDLPCLPRQPLFAVARVKVVLTGTGSDQRANITHKLYGLFRGEPVGYRACRKDAEGTETWTWKTPPFELGNLLVYDDQQANVQEWLRFIPLGGEGDLETDSPLSPSLQADGLLRIDQQAAARLFAGSYGFVPCTTTRPVQYPLADFAARYYLPASQVTQNAIPTAYESKSPNDDAPTNDKQSYTVAWYKMVRERVQADYGLPAVAPPPPNYPGAPVLPTDPHYPDINYVSSKKYYSYTDTITTGAQTETDKALGDKITLTIGLDSLDVFVSGQIYNRWCLGKRTRADEIETRIYYMLRTGGTPDPPSDNWNPDQTDADYAKKVWLFFQGYKYPTAIDCAAYAIPTVICDWLPVELWQGINNGTGAWSCAGVGVTADTAVKTYDYHSSSSWWVFFHALDYIDTYYDDQAYPLPYADDGYEHTWPEMLRMARKDCQRWSEQDTAWTAFKAEIACTDPAGPGTPDPDTGPGYYKWQRKCTGYWTWQCVDDTTGLPTSYPQSDPMDWLIDEGDCGTLYDENPGASSVGCGTVFPPSCRVPASGGPAFAGYACDPGTHAVSDGTYPYFTVTSDVATTWTKAGCPPFTPTGACCKHDGTCEILSEADCAAAGGKWHGYNSVCVTTKAAQDSTHILCDCCLRRKRDPT